MQMKWRFEQEMMVNVVLNPALPSSGYSQLESVSGKVSADALAEIEARVSAIQKPSDSCPSAGNNQEVASPKFRSGFPDWGKAFPFFRRTRDKLGSARGNSGSRSEFYSHASPKLGNAFLI
jgi:hypothetical protein